jgi:hypothetical protein
VDRDTLDESKKDLSGTPQQSSDEQSITSSPMYDGYLMRHNLAFVPWRNIPHWPTHMGPSCHTNHQVNFLAMIKLPLAPQSVQIFWTLVPAFRPP